MKRKFLALLLALVMCLSLLSVGVMASEEAETETAPAEETLAPAPEEPVETETAPAEDLIPDLLEEAEKNPAPAEEPASEETEVSDGLMLTAAEEAVNAEVTASGSIDDLTWSLDSDGKLTVTGTGVVYQNWEEYVTDIKTIELGSGVTGIGYMAFSGCTELTSVTIPDTVTWIDYCAFEGCTSLTGVAIPAAVRMLSSGVFSGCTGLTAITVDGGNERYCAENGVLYSKDKTELVLYPAGKTDTSFTVPSGVTSIGWQAFKGSTHLKSVTVSDSVKIISSEAFSGCTGLSAVTLGTGLTTVGYRAFDGTHWLEANHGLVAANNTVYLYAGTDASVTIESGITKIAASAFDSNTSLTSITIPASVTEIGDWAFAGCENLATINIEGTPTIGENAFNGTAWIAAQENTDFVILANTLIEYNGADTAVKIPDAVTAISSWAFSSNQTMESVSIPVGVTSVGDYAFNGCSSLKTVTGGSGLKYVGNNAFSFCESLTSITLPDGLETLNSFAFSGCAALTSFAVPASVTDLVYGTFAGCESLTSVTLPSGLKSISKSNNNWVSGTFEGCESLTGITIPDSVTCIGSRAFRRCESLTSVTVPAAVTEIGNNAFYGCTKLAAINVASGNTAYSSIDGVLYTKDKSQLLSYPLGKTDKSYSVPDGVGTIVYGAFADCTALTEVVLPDSLAELKEFAFADCTGLKSVSIGTNVTSIGEKTFGGCSALKDITFLGNAPKISDTAFYGVTANAWYYDNYISTWTADTKVNYGGTLTWESKGEKYLTESVGTGEKAVTVTVSNADGTKWEVGTKLVVTAVESSVIDETTQTEAGILKYEVYDLSLIDSSQQSVEPNGDVTVSISVPSGFDGEKCQVYYVDNAGNLTPLYTIYEKGADGSVGTLRFTAEHFSNYAVAQVEKKYDPYENQDEPAEEPAKVVASGSAGENLTWKLDDKGTLSVTGSGAITYESDNTPWKSYSNQVTSVKIEEGVTAIADYAFYGCENLLSVTLPNSLKTIGISAFENCTALKAVTIPAGVTEIGEAAFADCSSLKTVTFLGDAPAIYANNDGSYVPVFYNVKATVTYPKDNSSWTKEIMDKFGGSITWKLAGETGSGSGNNSGGQSGGNPDTGDGTNIALWVVLLVLCGAGCALLARRKLRKN